MRAGGNLLPGIYVPPPLSRRPLSRRARALVVLLCFAAIATTALLARDVRDIAASFALGLLLALVAQVGRGATP